MILETAVGRARWCVRAGARREAMRQQARACNEERQSQALARIRQRVRSGLTVWVSVFNTENMTIHQAFQIMASGQLRFPG
jgi:hypothetical protein